MIALLTFFVVNLFVDYYIYRALIADVRNRLWSKVQTWGTLVCEIMLGILIFTPFNDLSDGALRGMMWLFLTYLSIYVAKYTFVTFDILSRAPALWHKPRARWMGKLGGWLGLLVFVLAWWGAFFGRYGIEVEKQDVEITNLPKGFDGLRIVHISDLHTGTWASDTTYLARVVDSVMAQTPDIIVFTGDIVNRNARELKPFMPVLGRLKAPMGVYSVLGNHDYGDYTQWPDQAAKQANLDSLKNYQQSMGWTMLNNTAVPLANRGDTVMLIGVENIGDPPFHKYGDLTKAYATPSDNRFKILLTHNPAHWDRDIRDHDTNIALTLSGHTHAMQVEAWGISPAAMRYPQWGGLYSDARGQQIYVNKGIGTVGIPTRVGATPEITVLTLRQRQ